MSLADDIAAALPELQREDEARMTDSITFTRPGEGEPVWNPESGQYEQPQVTVYSGPCRLRWANPAPQSADTTVESHAVDRTPVVRLPISDPTSADVADGMTGTITAVGPGSAARVGLVLSVITGHWQTDSTARRIPCEVVSRDAGPA